MPTRRHRRLGAWLLAVVLSCGSLPVMALDDRVVPVEDWYTLETIVLGDAPYALHLRTGHARPLVLPEPVERDNRIGPNPALTVEIDREIVVLSPTGHFDNRSLRLLGLDSGTVYAFVLRASTSGERTPVRVIDAAPRD